MRKCCIILLLSIFSITRPTIHAQQDPIHQQLQNLIDRLVSQDGYPGMVLWIDSPDLYFEGASGYADSEMNILMQSDDAFRVASVTKLFTATVILQLMEEHRLTLEDTLDMWGLDFDPHITIRQLLNHTSGITNYTDKEILATLEYTDVYRRWFPEDILALIAGNPYQFAPGEFWEYSNTNYIILGMIIETATRATLATNFRERIIEPLNLTSTYLAEMEPPTAQLVRGKSYFFDADHYDASMVWAAGGLISNAPDLITFARALFNGELFEEATTLQQMLTFEMTPREAQFNGYGLGVEMSNTPIGRYWGHDGGIAGFAANLMYFEKHDMVIVALINTDMTFGIDKPALFDILRTR